MGEKSKKEDQENVAPSSSSPPPSPPATATATARGGTGAAERIELPSSSCFHGSNLADFKYLEYKGAIQAYTLMYSDLDKIGDDNQIIALQGFAKFNDYYKHLRKHDANFCCFLFFAYCTHLYQKYYHLSANYQMEVTRLINWGIQIRYQDQVEKGVSFGLGYYYV